ncbi:hypothetical protein PENNAL_c0029G07002 [Penicillium nalgiovense]|uniref:Uncharacterized protein n=1 Tax=Penicillium nalgiovense TaxID=60175 RepID=A0A1V6Y9X6_PENNA|nr:hypothetical protein PENNAL_c0029G07002 [Penicillium nalgiovense]
MRNKRQSFFRCIIAILSPSVQTGSDLAMRPTTGGFSFLLGVPVRQTDQDSLLGRVMIGKVPHEVTYAQIRDLLESIPLPQKDALPEQNCVTWTRAAINKLQDNSLAEQFELDRFMDKSLAFADQRLHTGCTPTSINYTTRPM